MQNDRPLHNEHIQTALDVFHATCQAYDLTGCVCFGDAEEWGFAYHPCATWNATIEDATLPLGFRVRAATQTLGQERAREMVRGTAGTWGMMADFGMQTMQWGKDLLRILRQAGIEVRHVPFGGRKLPHLTSEPPR